ncbi:MAG TPA: hypothetical protein VGS11_04590 [Candidatus Bathyarchaeia archaeon]|nr:hypothetical protein [Candidatus Bathyarchaeia archaeon]
MKSMAITQIKILANFVSSALTLGSIFVPWISYSTGGTLTLIQAQDAWLSAALVSSGGIISLLSRYGGLLSMAGLWRFAAGPPVPLLFTASNVTITSSFETGFWLAWVGATTSLVSNSWILPFGLPKTEADWKNFGLILFPIGVVATVFGFVLPIPGSIILTLGGLIILATCLVLLLLVRGHRLAQTPVS